MDEQKEDEFAKKIEKLNKKNARLEIQIKLLLQHQEFTLKKLKEINSEFDFFEKEKNKKIE